MDNMLLVIDPGHGGKDPGSTGYGLIEKYLTLDSSKRVAAKLQQYEDIEVKLTRDDDRYLSLNERADIANRLNADFFISIHINAGGGTGFESFVHTGSGDKTKTIRTMIHAEIRKFLDAKGIFDRGGKFANFAVLRETNMPAILLENLFIDTAKDAALLKQGQFIDELAGAIVAGLVRAFSLVKKETERDGLVTAVDVLVKAGVINSPDFWLSHAKAGQQVPGDYVATLIQKMASKL
jgi:N-acetylmuramoyl-L-alanine amidase